MRREARLTAAMTTSRGRRRWRQAADGAAAAVVSGGGEEGEGDRRGAGDRMVVTAGIGVHRTGRRKAAELRCSAELGLRRGGVSSGP